VAFFAQEHKKRAKRHLYQTSLYKYLAFLDFCSLKETGRPALGLIYKAMDYGPVPIEIYGDKTETATYQFMKDEQGEFVIAKKKPNLDYFSPYELDLMNRLVEIYAQCWITTNVVSDASHESINAWRRTYSKTPNGIINYALEFDGDIDSKTEDELSSPEEVYLTYRALTS
jgi:uncharacterized phage-associated protein